MSRWTDQFVGDRMAVDRAFSERVAASEFSSQEWGTIMTAVELEIENPDDPEAAEVVADTSSVDQVMPALDEMRESMPGVAEAAGGSTRGSSGAGSDGGLWFSLKRVLGLGTSESDHRAEAARALAEEYARQFQDHLQEQGKWERACEVAASESDADGSSFEDAPFDDSSVDDGQE